MPLRVDPREVLGMTVSEALADALRADIAVHEQQTVAFWEWAMKVPEPRGPLNFERWPFQRELYEEGFEDREMVVMKATQLGISAWLVRWALCWADVRGARVVYVFPRERQLLDFSDGRVRPLILSKYLRTRVPPSSVQNKALKTVGLGLVYFRGSEAEAGLESIDADCLALDEYDLLVPAHVPVVERRIGASELGLIRRIGFPTIADRGIHREYTKTDQREWMVRCEHCSHWQKITWLDNVDVEREMRVCARCRKGPLNVLEGEWVAEFPDRQYRGYHVTKLIMPRPDMRRLIDASRQREPYKRQVFHNRDLGEPWEGEGNRLTPALIAAAQRSMEQQGGYDGANTVLAGIDVASVRALNVWISERISDQQGRTLYLGLVDSFTELSALMDRYRVNMAAIDHLPENRLARAFANRFAGRVYLVNYAEQRDVLSIDEQQGQVSVRRTEAIDAASERIRAQREYLPLDLPDSFVEQMCTNVRSSEQDDVGRVRVVYRADGPDDWMQALTYLVVAAECWWMRQQVTQSTEVVALEDEVDFERSNLGSPDGELEYSPGRGDGEYAYDPAHVQVDVSGADEWED